MMIRASNRSFMYSSHTKRRGLTSLMSYHNSRSFRRKLPNRPFDPDLRKRASPTCSAGQWRRWTDEAKPRTKIIRTTNRTPQAAAGIGVVCSTSGFDSGDAAVSIGGALSDGLSAGGGHSGHEPSVRPRLALGSWGSPIRLASGSHVGAVSDGGASAASIATVGHRRCFGVVQRRRHYSFEPVDRSGR